MYVLRRQVYTKMIILHGFFFVFFFVRFVFFLSFFLFCFSPIIAAVPLYIMISCSTKGMLYYIHVLIIRITTIIIVSDRFRKPKLLSITSSCTYIHTIYIKIYIYIDIYSRLYLYIYIIQPHT